MPKSSICDALSLRTLVNSAILARFRVILMWFIILQACDERRNLSVAASYQAENGFITTVGPTESEKTAYAFLPQIPTESTDAHLVEFAEAMRSNNTNSWHHSMTVTLLSSTYMCLMHPCV
jgi:hypothetical protein